MTYLLRGSVDVLNEVEIKNDLNNPIPVTMAGDTTNPINVTVENEVEIKNDLNNPIPVTIGNTDLDPVPVIIQNGSTAPLQAEIIGGTIVAVPIFGSLDAFGRQRISTPFTLFDSQHRYKKNVKWTTGVAVNGTSDYIAAESAINMTVTNEIGSKVIEETTRVMAYQPGKSLLILMTFVLNIPKAGLRQRVGYFGTNNGVYLETNGTDIFFKLRSQSLGTTFSAIKSSWNGSTFPNLNIDKCQILWFDIEWLGVGDVRCGFVEDGKYVLAHTFHNENERTTTFMTTACLPLRLEIENLTSTSGSSVMKSICSTVISEGGYSQVTKQWTATRTSAIASTAVGNYAPVVCIRLASGREDSIIVPGQIHISGSGNNSLYEYALIRNATIVGGDWTNHTESGGNIDYNVNATSMSGGVVEETGFVASSNQAKTPMNSNLAYIFDLQLGRDLTPTSDTMTLAVRHLLTGGDVYGSLNWNDLLT